VVWLSTGGSLTGAPMGLVTLLIASVSWSFGSIWSRGRDLPSPFMSSAAQMLCGWVMLLSVGLAMGERLHGLPTALAIGAFWYLVMMGSLVGFSAYIWLLHHVRPALAGSYAYVNPAIAVALGAWLAHERFGLRELVAMGVILAGVVAITLAKARKPKAAS
jgi:drug/metabolite transporter (DMT)-like permease